MYYFMHASNVKDASSLIFLACILLAHAIATAGESEPKYTGKPLSAWIAEYGEGPRGYRPSTNADAALRQIGSNAVPYLLDLLHATKPRPAPTLLKSDGAQSSTQVRSIPPSWDHWKAYVAFQALGPEGRSGIPDLLKLAGDPRGTGYPNIGGSKDIRTIAALAKNSITYVADDEPSFNGGRTVRSTAMRTTEPFLVDGEIAAWSLAAIGQESVAPLMVLLTNAAPQLKARAAQALGMIGADAGPAVPILIEYLHDPDHNVSYRAADALGWIGQRPELAVPALIATLKGPYSALNYYAAESLGRFGAGAAAAIPALLDRFGDNDYRTRGSAIYALSRISRETTEKKVLPSVLRHFQDLNPNLRSGAVAELMQLRMFPEAVIPVFIAGLDDPDRTVRMNSINGLGLVGPAAKDAIPKLNALLDDSSYFVREDASNALAKISPQRTVGGRVE